MAKPTIPGLKAEEQQQLYEQLLHYNEGRESYKEAKKDGSIDRAKAEPKCPNCGADTAPGQKFCSNCGTQLG